MTHREPFELGPIRPVAEGDSLLIRTTRGCSWHRCAFCTSYRGHDFSIRSVQEIKRDIDAAAEYYRGHPFEACFLQDGDSLIMKTGELLEILVHLKERFPRLERVTSYGRASTVARKSRTELKELRAAGLNRIYSGMESGSDRILALVNKGITAADIVKSGQEAKEAGIEVSEFIILGLGGREHSREHALETARILVETDPAFIRVRTIRVKPDSPLDLLRREGRYVLQSEEEYIAEQRLLLENLDGATGYLSNDHSMNLLMEVEGQLPAARNDLLAVLDEYLGLPQEDKEIFNIAVRLRLLGRLADLRRPQLREHAKTAVEQVRKDWPMDLNELYNLIRIRTS